MVLTWQHIIIIIIAFAPPTSTKQYSEESLGYVHNKVFKTTDPRDWRVIEALAEEHPYIVALLSSMKDYICTGSIINKRCVITSGNCINHEPKYVAVSTAVYNKKVNNNSIFNVASTIIHGDYIFELQTADPNVTRLHSNIGLVFVDRPFLDLFINVADLGNYYATELTGKRLTAIGYGGLGEGNIVGLQYQGYQQTPCMNPKWYYCICGIEYTSMFKTYIDEFGIGAPVMLDSVIVGISAAPTGTLTMKTLGIKYNIFTVVGPYLSWMEKSTRRYIPVPIEKTYRSKSADIKQSILLKYFHILIMVSYTFF